MQCPWCKRRLTGSISKGRRSKYRYYHCASSKCRGRFRADALDTAYEEQLKNVRLIPAVYSLFELVLQDENIFSARKEHSDERKIILSEIEKQQSLLSKARKLLLTQRIDFDDFNELKKEYNQVLISLNDRLNHINTKLMNGSCNDFNLWPNANVSIFQCYKDQDIAGKRHIISLLSPTSIDSFSNTLRPLQLNDALVKIISLS